MYEMLLCQKDICIRKMNAFKSLGYFYQIKHEKDLNMKCKSDQKHRELPLPELKIPH